MSAFLGQSNSWNPIFGNFTRRNVDALQHPDYKTETYRAEIEFRWPRASMQGIAMVMQSYSQLWEPWTTTAGVSVPKKVRGITRDSTGAVLGNATVQLFNTSTGLLVATAVSDASGNYEVDDPNGVACFVVSYKTGSPDITGATVNTLTGT